jgi:predicted nucleotidyltransferase
MMNSKYFQIMQCAGSNINFSARMRIPEYAAMNFTQQPRPSLTSRMRMRPLPGQILPWRNSRPRIYFHAFMSPGKMNNFTLFVPFCIAHFAVLWDNLIRITMNYKTIFKKYNPIVTAYLFGSRARGDFSSISDYDFAVQLDEKFPKHKHIDIKLALIGDLCSFLKSDDVDVVILNEAPLLLKHRVIKDRKILFCRSQLKRIRYETSILIQYLDEKDYEVSFAKGIFQSILEAA